VTGPHVGCSKDQIAQAVLGTELDTTPANAVVIDAVAKFCPQSDQRGQDGEMHDVFIVTSEGGGGGHIVRTVSPPARTTHAKHTRTTTPTSQSSRYGNRDVVHNRPPGDPVGAASTPAGGFQVR
jgi:hypothetical protein